MSDTYITVDEATSIAHVRGWSRELLTELAKRVKDDAVRLCPVDTGTLRKSIRYRTRVLSSRMVARISANTEYAVYVEQGTKKMRAQPFLRPALYRIRVTRAGVV